MLETVLTLEVAVHDGFALVGLRFFDGFEDFALDDFGESFHHVGRRVHIGMFFDQLFNFASND